MQTKQQWFLEFLGQPNTQFIIPAYQRVYSWLDSQREELWNDIMRCGQEQVSHYMSTTLFLDAGTTPDGARKYDIIDGQQRIASTCIVLTALRDYMRETGVVIKERGLANRPEVEAGVEYDAESIHSSYLVVKAGENEEAKIKLIGPDHATLTALILETEIPERSSARVKESYDYFSKRMHAEGFDAQMFWVGLRELLIISAELDEGDKAQKIFEGLNTKGIALSAADLMRNYLLVGKSRQEQHRLYLEYWQPMEILFQDDQNSSRSLKLNTGLRMWLAIRFKGMCISDRSRTYHYFKQYMETVYDGTTEELLDEMRSFSFLWSKNYTDNGGRVHCSRFAWAKNGRHTLIPPMERASDVRARLRQRRELSDEAQAAEEPLDENVSYERMTFGIWGGIPIVWRVLDRDDESALLITERVIDNIPYQSHYVSTTWENSSLRYWANTSFATNAFSDEESSRLMVNTVHTPDDELWFTVGGGDCEDRVFILSVEEALEYFEDNYDRKAKPTYHAKKNDVFVENDYCLWWLRSPGHGQGFASTVWPVGGVDTAGSGVGRPGVGFRPVIRVKL